MAAARTLTWLEYAEMMKTSPRHKSEASEHKLTNVCYVCLLALVSGVAWLCYVCPVVLIAGVPLVSVVWALSLFERQERKKMAVYRLEVNIHALAGSLESRRVDIRLIRAIYEELQKRCKGERGISPIRASDRTEEDLNIGRDELWEVARHVAVRMGYDSTDMKRNPLFDGMETVEDLVLYLAHRARISEADQQSSLTADRVSINGTLVPDSRLRAAS